MSSWAKTDAAGSAPLWAASQFGLAPTTGNRTTLFGNTTADQIITNSTIGLFNYTHSEVPAGAHQGWVLKTTGKSSSGRDGRVTVETLVCMTSNT